MINKERHINFNKYAPAYRRSITTITTTITL